MPGSIGLSKLKCDEEIRFDFWTGAGHDTDRPRDLHGEHRLSQPLL